MSFEHDVDLCVSVYTCSSGQLSNGVSGIFSDRGLAIPIQAVVPPDLRTRQEADEEDSLKVL